MSKMRYYYYYYYYFNFNFNFARSLHMRFHSIVLSTELSTDLEVCYQKFYM